MTGEGKIQVVVKSRKVPTGIVVRNEPIFTTSGVLLGHQPRRMILYETTLDDSQKRTVEGAQRLAASLGLELEVVDESVLGFLGRVLSKFNRGGYRYSSAGVHPSRDMVSLDAPPAISRGC